MSQRIRFTFIAITMVFVAGCGSAVSSGHNTALDAVDLQKMTSDMAAGIAGSPQVQAAIAQEPHHRLRIVCQPVINQMVGEVLPRGQAEAYTARVRDLLSEHASDRFMFIMNRDEFYDLRRQELSGVSLGPDPDAINPDYALTARFNSITNESADQRNSFYLCVYELTSLRDRTVLWNGTYRVQKVAVKGFLD